MNKGFVGKLLIAAGAVLLAIGVLLAFFTESRFFGLPIAFSIAVNTAGVELLRRKK